MPFPESRVIVLFILTEEHPIFCSFDKFLKDLFSSAISEFILPPDFFSHRNDE